MSKSLFLLLFFPVVLLATAAKFQSGGGWWGEIQFAVRAEVSEDIGSLKYDAIAIRQMATQLPIELRNLREDTKNDLEKLRTDVKLEARRAAQQLRLRFTDS